MSFEPRSSEGDSGYGWLTSIAGLTRVPCNRRLSNANRVQLDRAERASVPRRRCLVAATDAVCGSFCTRGRSDTFRRLMSFEAPQLDIREEVKESD